MKKNLMVMAYIMLGCAASYAQESITPPIITPGYGESFFRKQQISFSCATEGATIYYTTDGTVPTTSSTEYSEEEPLYIDKTTTIKAIAVKETEKSGISQQKCTKNTTKVYFTAESGGATFYMGKSSIKNNFLEALKITDRQYLVEPPSTFPPKNAWDFNSDGTIQDPDSKKYLTYDPKNSTESNLVLSNNATTKWKLVNGKIRTDDKYNRFLGFHATSGHFASYTDDKQQAAKATEIRKGGTKQMPNYTLGTSCYPYDIVAGDHPGAIFYNILGKKTESNGNITLYIIEETGTLKGGVPHIIKSEADIVYVYYLDEVQALKTPPPYQSVNGLVSNFENGIEIPEGMYIIYNNQLRKCGKGCIIDRSSAYINMDEVPEISESTATAKKAIRITSGRTTAINGISATAHSNSYYNLQGQRVESPQNGIYIVNGKKMIIK